MNKEAYELGVQLALEDVGLSKTAISLQPVGQALKRFGQRAAKSRAGMAVQRGVSKLKPEHVALLGLGGMGAAATTLPWGSGEEK